MVNHLVYQESFAFTLRKKVDDNIIPFNDRKQLIIHNMQEEIDKINLMSGDDDNIRRWEVNLHERKLKDAIQTQFLITTFLTIFVGILYYYSFKKILIKRKLIWFFYLNILIDISL